MNQTLRNGCLGWILRLAAPLVAVGLGGEAAGTVVAKPSGVRGGADTCRIAWEGKWGELKELRPSRLSGLREMQLRDGNIIFIDKSCEHVVIGEVLSRMDLIPSPAPVRLDRGAIRLGQLVSVGPAKASISWIFVVGQDDLGVFKSGMKERPEWDRAGYYLGIVKSTERKRDLPGCRFANTSQIDEADRLSECANGLDLGVLSSLSAPFALAPDGTKHDFSWEMGLPAWQKK